MTRTQSAAGTVACALLLLLAACVPAPAGEERDALDATPVETTVDTPEDAAPAPGDPISDAQAMACRKDLGGPCSAYRLDDGSWIYLDKNAPLPPVVQEAVTRTANAAPAPTGTSPDEQSASGRTLTQTQGAIEFATGKPVVLVLYGSWHRDGDSFLGYCAIGIRAEFVAASRERATVVAEAEAYIAANGGSDLIALVVQD